MVKIRNISINGLRGVRDDLSIALNGKSILLYGDNGSGKSTLSDVLEWFYYDRIDHLIGEEIGRKGYEALRNIFLDDNEPGSLSLEFTKSQYNTLKTIELKNGLLKANFSNESKDLNDYLGASQGENLTLRYKELVTFVLSSKSDKLRALSGIIGYSKVTDTRDVLRTVYNRISRDLRSKAFDDHINHQQAQIIGQFGQNVTSDQQFIEVIKQMVLPLKLGMTIDTLKDINNVLKKIKKPNDTKEVMQEVFLLKIEESLISLTSNLDELESQYKDYKTRFDTIVSDIEKVKKLAIEKLLDVGKEILMTGGYTENKCPLCLEEQDKEELLSSIRKRIALLQEIKQEGTMLNESNRGLKQQIISTIHPLQSLYEDKQINEAKNAKNKAKIEAIIEAIKQYEEPLKRKIIEETKLSDDGSLLIDRDAIRILKQDCMVQLEAIRKSRKADPKWDIHSKINIASHAYVQIKLLQKQKSGYEKQRNTMEVVYQKFLKEQKESLETFLDTFSERIDEIYQFLNPGEKVENIKLIPLEKDDELSGITMKFDFLDNKEVTPPHKFLSESHINCLGIAFFLTSVDAFNQQNKFMVLDDVISSFDANHRKRFADLLVEKYKDHQIILLTHEKTWFEIVKNMVRGKDWYIKSLKHTEANGTYIEQAPQTLKERIEQKISAGDVANLGNEGRIYLEHQLKHIAHNLEIKLAFRFNEVNEDRMAFELLTELKGTIRKRKCIELQAEPVIDRLLGSLFIANKGSHDTSIELSPGDKKAFWQDVKDFEKLLFCNTCGSQVSLRYYDEGTKQVRCKMGHLCYTWKK